MTIKREGTELLHRLPIGAVATFARINGEPYVLVSPQDGEDSYLVDGNGDIFGIEVSKP